MAINSCTKGKVGEREAAELLRSFGFEAKRGQQHKGGPESQDVEHNIPGFHLEVKRTETFNAYKAMEQAERDAGPLVAPVVLHRRNRKGWLVVMRAEDLLPLLKGKLEKE